MNPFDLHRINSADGYETLDYEIPVYMQDKMDLVCISDKYLLYKIRDLKIYLLSVPQRMTQIVYHTSLSKKSAKKHLDNLYGGKINYIQYDNKGSSSYCKQILPDVYTKPSRIKFINQIIDKMSTHPKLNINLLLTGSPGTGKSSFVEVVAKHYKTNIHIVPTCDISSMSYAIKTISVRKNIVVLFPEIDKLLDDMGNLIHENTELYEFLDGSNTPAGSIIIITCNDAEKFHKNKILSRPGRIHFVHDFGLIEEEDIDFIVHKYFPDADASKYYKYVNKITHAEFHTAVCQKYIIDETLDTLDIKGVSHKKNKTNIYF